jgi:hypothetical protein
MGAFHATVKSFVKLNDNITVRVDEGRVGWIECDDDVNRLVIYTSLVMSTRRYAPVTSTDATSRRESAAIIEVSIKELWCTVGEDLKTVSSGICLWPPATRRAFHLMMLSFESNFFLRKSFDGIGLIGEDETG